MKKIISLLVIAAMLVTALASCGTYDVRKLNLDEYVRLGDYSTFTAEEFAQKYYEGRDVDVTNSQVSYNVNWGYSVEFNLVCEIVTVDGDKTTYTKFDELCYEGDKTAKINLYEDTQDANRCTFDSSFVYDVDNMANIGSSAGLRTITVGTAFSFEYDMPYNCKYDELKNQTVNFTVTPVKIWAPLYSDDEIVDTLDAFIADHPVTQTVLAVGDQVYTDITATIDGEAWEDGTLSGHTFMLGYSQWSTDFDDALVGHKVGETVSFSVSFPSDWNNADIAGKTVDFAVTTRSSVNYDRTIAANTAYSSLYEYKEALRVAYCALYDIISVIAGRSELIEVPAELLKQFKAIYKGQADNTINDYMASVGATKDEAFEYLFGGKDGYEVFINENADASAFETLVVYALFDALHLRYSDEMYQSDLQKLTDKYNSYYQSDYTTKQFEKLNGELLLRLVFMEDILCNDRIHHVEGLPEIITEE